MGLGVQGGRGRAASGGVDAAAFPARVLQALRLRHLAHLVLLKLGRVVLLLLLQQFDLRGCDVHSRVNAHIHIQHVCIDMT